MRITHVRCPDCEYEGALRNDGGAKVVGGGQLKGSTKDVGVTRASAGCPTCGGRGSIPTSDIKTMAKAGIERPALADRDPYSLPLTPEQAARMRRRG